jgi:hypothetical protein
MVQHAFGFKFTKDDVVFDFETKALSQGIRRIFQDLRSDRGSVSNIKNKGDRVDYVKATVSVQPSVNKRLDTPRLPGTRSTAQPAGGTRKSTSPGSVPAPIKPETVIFEGLALSHFSSRMQELLKAAQSLRIDDFTPVCAVMLRVVIELAVTEIGTQRSWLKESDTFAAKVRKVLLNLDPNCENPRKRNKALAAAWTSSQNPTGGSGIGVDQMNSYVHNVMGHPIAADVRKHSENFRPLLEQMNTYQTTHPKRGGVATTS